GQATELTAIVLAELLEREANDRVGDEIQGREHAVEGLEGQQHVEDRELDQVRGEGVKLGRVDLDALKLGPEPDHLGVRAGVGDAEAAVRGATPAAAVDVAAEAADG